VDTSLVLLGSKVLSPASSCKAVGSMAERELLQLSLLSPSPWRMVSPLCSFKINVTSVSLDLNQCFRNRILKLAL
jgi:hypothetical protein